MSFDYLGKVFVGDTVEVSTNRELTDPKFGEVIKVGANAVNIRYFTETEFGAYKFCWHMDDPRMQELGKWEASRDRNTNDVTGEIGTGIFRFTRNQKILSELPRRMAELAERLSAQDAMMERLARRIDALERKPEPKKRGPKSRPKNLVGAVE